MKGLLIPHNAELPITVLDVPEDDALSMLQAKVGGMIEALQPPWSVDPTGHTTSYINEEGKYLAWTNPETDETQEGLPGNVRATRLMAVSLMPGDFIAGNMVVIGFDPSTGRHLPVRDDVEAKVRAL